MAIPPMETLLSTIDWYLEPSEYEPCVLTDRSRLGFSYAAGDDHYSESLQPLQQEGHRKACVCPHFFVGHSKHPEPQERSNDLTVSGLRV